MHHHASEVDDEVERGERNAKERRDRPAQTPVSIGAFVIVVDFYGQAKQV